jgi:hypothetical protein
MPAGARGARDQPRGGGESGTWNRERARDDVAGRDAATSDGVVIRVASGTTPVEPRIDPRIAESPSVPLRSAQRVAVEGLLCIGQTSAPVPCAQVQDSATPWEAPLQTTAAQTTGAACPSRTNTTVSASAPRRIH